MSISTRVYKIQTRALDGSLSGMRFVEACTPAQALRHVAHDLFDVKVATTKELGAAMRNDATIQVEIAHELTD